VAEIKSIEGTSNPLSAQTAEDFAPRTKLSRDSPLRTSLMPHPKRISSNQELSNNTSSLSFTLKCNTASPALFTTELSKSDQLLIEKSELPHKESKEMLLEKLSKREKNRNEIV
jgi:hypothetical protein